MVVKRSGKCVMRSDGDVMLVCDEMQGGSVKREPFGMCAEAVCVGERFD